MSQRTERVARQLVREIGEILREEISDPNLGMVTVLNADISKDLRIAKVHYSVLGSEEQKKATDIAIHQSAKYFKKMVNDRLQLRYAVDLHFVRENSIDHSIRIDEILENIRKEDKP